MRSLPLPAGMLLLATSCGHYYLPGHVLDTPEAIGPAGRGRFEAVGIQGARDLGGEPRQGGADPETGEVPTPYLPYSPAHFFTGLQLALGDRIDGGVRFQPYGPLLLRFKYQMTGEPESSSAPGNFSASLLGSGGLTLGSGSSYLTGDAALLGGYRAWRNHLFSLGGLARLGAITAEAERSGAAAAYGFCGGYQYTVESLITRAELTWTAGSFDELDIGGVSIGAMLGFRF